ncbi:hypothetical protein TPY_2261 [Sulfobacillus acidophilus TPY]|nr:hypothetical protein TPY_2261 [Sulfobacillus acidophilus TPY]
MGPTPATQSRVLRAAEARSQSVDGEPTPAVSYRSWIDEGGAPHV